MRPTCPTHRINALRDVVARIERSAAPPNAPPPLPFGLSAIDAALPGGGLPLGALHEIAGAGADAQHGAAAALFAAGILARIEGPILWVLEGRDLFAPGLAAAGLHPDRVVYAEAGRRDALLVMEEGLRHRGLAGVAAEISSRITLSASRRLQLAAEATGVTALMLRRPNPSPGPGPGPNKDVALAGAVAAVTRWRIGALPSAPPIAEVPDVPGLGRARWRLDLLRCRGGQTGSWMVEACDASGRLDLVAPLADRPAARALGHDAPPRDQPLITAIQDGNRRVIEAADAEAARLGLRRGMAVAQAMAVVPGLQVLEADPEADAAALLRLARWCQRLTPLAAPDVPDGIFLDVAGCAHLWEGEQNLLNHLVARLAQDGVSASAAIADTPGAAHAMARHGTDKIVPPRTQAEAIATLPIAALRLPETMVATLRRLGFEQIGPLARVPRALLARRFGPEPGRRIDQAHGTSAEPLQPLAHETKLQHRIAFLEPLLTAEALSTATASLLETLCPAMERAGLGARRIDLLFERVDGTVQATRIGTARPNRDPKHLHRLLDEHLPTIDPGLGIEAMRLVIPLAEPLRWQQNDSAMDGSGGGDVSTLVDRLSNRLGADRVYRAAPVESDVPERAVRRIPALARPCGKSWPGGLAPTRLFHPPRPVDALAELPDHPPAAFTWRRHRHRVRRADGPERIYGEWWRRDAETNAVRDYFRVEDEEGRRFLLFRQGDGVDLRTGGLQWFMQGMF